MAGYQVDEWDEEIQVMPNNNNNDTPSHNKTDTQVYINGYTTLAIFVNYDYEPWAELSLQDDDGQLLRKYQIDNGTLVNNGYDKKTVTVRFAEFKIKLHFLLRNHIPHLDIEIYEYNQAFGNTFKIIDNLSYPPENIQ